MTIKEMQEKYGVNKDYPSPEEVRQQVLVNQYALLQMMSEQLMKKEEIEPLLRATERCLEDVK